MSSYGDEGVPRPTWEHIGINSGATWQTVDPTQSLWISYNRGLNFSTQGSPVLEAEFAPKDGAALVAWLNAQVGKTFVDGFNERHLEMVRKTVFLGGDWTVVGDPDGLLSWDESIVRGDIQIRSVTVVPEPASSVLLGVGLLALVCSRARRRVNVG
jgi:hypothetical protein